MSSAYIRWPAIGGTVTIGSPANGLSILGQVLSLGLSSTSTTGALSSTDWNTFNSKQPALGYTPENVANKGQPNGYAPLDGAAKVPYANLPSAIMTYKGAWDPTTNTPTLANGTGTNGDVYRASVDGVSSAPIVATWYAGDFIIYNGTTWQRSPLADGVVSVNGLTGAVTLTQGNLTDAGTDGIVITNGTNAVWGSGTSLAQHVADTTHNGYLSSTDWNTFNGKQAAGNYITALTGDVTASGPGSAAATLATVNANTGSFGSSTSIPNFTVNAKGLITAAGSNVVIAPAGTLTGTTLAANVVTSSLTALGTITVGVWTGTTIAIANGGTGQTTKSAAFDALSPMTTGGDLIYGGASGTGTRLANGTSGQVLQSNGTTTAPTWTTNISGNAANVTGTVAIANGGTGQTTKAAGFDALSPMTTGGDIIYGGASGTGTRLANGTSGQVLTSNGGTTAPSWQTAGSGFSNSQVRVDTANGYGSSATSINRWTNSTTVGTDITYADSSTNGASFTVNTAGVYSVSFWFYSNTVGGVSIGGTLNQGTLTQNINSVTTTERISNNGVVIASGADGTLMVSSVIICAVNDVIRLNGGATTAGNNARCGGIVARVH